MPGLATTHETAFKVIIILVLFRRGERNRTSALQQSNAKPRSTNTRPAPGNTSGGDKTWRITKRQRYVGSGQYRQTTERACR